MEFADRETAEAWYASDAYQAIVPLRTHHTISDLIFIDHLPEGFTVEGFAEQVRTATASQVSTRPVTA